MDNSRYEKELELCMLASQLLDTKIIFSESSPYDDQVTFDTAKQYKRDGDYLASFELYLQMYHRGNQMSLMVVTGLFKDLMAGGAILEAINLANLCFTTFLGDNIQWAGNIQIQQLGIHEISAILCVLGYCNKPGYSDYQFEKYLPDLSGNSAAYVMPTLSFDYETESRMERLLSLFSKYFSSLVAEAESELKMVSYGVF